MKLNQKGFNDVITVTIIGGIIGALFIAGVFVWQEINLVKSPYLVSYQISDNKEKCKVEISHPESEGAYSILKICGIETDYLAQEFPEFNFILYDKDGSLELLDTDTFEQAILAEKIDWETMSLSGGNCELRGSLYICDSHGDGPGYLDEVFVFNPENKDYIYFKDGSYGSTSKLFIASSLSEEYFTGILEKNCLPDDMFCSYDNAQSIKVEITKDGRYDYYNKQQFLDNSDNINTLFTCKDSLYTRNNLIKDFAILEKLNCYSSNGKDILGYFDLKDSEFKVE